MTIANGDNIVWQNKYRSFVTVFDFDLSEDQYSYDTLDYSKLHVEITTSDEYDDKLVERSTANVTKTKTLDTYKFKKDYWQITPTLKVTQIGHNIIHLDLSGSKALANKYSYTVTADQQTIDAGSIGNADGYDVVIPDTGLSATLTVTVVPEIDSSARDEYKAEASIAMNNHWDSVANVSLTDADGKKGDYVKVTYSYDGPADGVYVQLYNITTGKAIFETPVQVTWKNVTLNLAKKTVTFTFPAPLAVGKYYVEVTPYITDQEANVTTIGDSVKSAKTATLTIPVTKK